MTDNSTPGNIFSAVAKLKLSQVSVETEDVLQQILEQIPTFRQDAESAILYDYNDVVALDPRHCPRFRYPKNNPKKIGELGARVYVFNQDTLDTALKISQCTTNSVTTVAEQAEGHAGQSGPLHDAYPAAVFKSSSIDGTTQENIDPQAPPKPILVLNLASDTTPGGGWREGIMGQEEELFYRTSLCRSLNSAFYPLKLLNAIYSPKVFLIRGPYGGSEGGHQLCFSPSVASTPRPSCPLAQKLNTKHGAFAPGEFPVVSVLSIAAIRDPCVTPDGTYQHSHDKDIMKYKIRLMLRIAAKHGHRKLILGALGCGAFHNPPKDVANAYLEVFQEPEFQGGWWDQVVFAVLSNVKPSEIATAANGNYRHFLQVLDGKIV